MMLSTRTKPIHIDVHGPPSYTPARLKILCATDLSSKSEPAIRRALSLAQTLDGQVMLLHVVDSKLTMRLAGRRAERAHSALQWHARRHAHLRVAPELSVRVGDAHSTIARVAKNWNADLIVLGAHTKRRAQILRWTTAERIVHSAKRPVLVVNSDADRDYRGVTFVARNDIGLFVQAADQFDLFSTAHVSVAPHAAMIDRIACLFGSIMRRTWPMLAMSLQALVHRRSQRIIDDAGLHLLGFELVGGAQSARTLLSHIKKDSDPQLLVAAIGRSSMLTGALPRSAASLALRTRACDVLVASTASLRQILHSPVFSPRSDDACEDAVG